jgi:NADH:ubiquinone oxidoreductase subunit 4 (subunit M)
MTALVYYVLVYLAANLGVFAVISIVEQRSNKVEIDDYNGLYKTNPKLAFIMTLALFSLAGIPPFAGFFSKFFIFTAAFNSGFHLLVSIARIKAATGHLKGLKIGIMGCIVNGPGEMADADYGYVGAGRGKISLYKKKECIEKNIPEEEAVEKLIELIKSNGDYAERT